MNKVLRCHKPNDSLPQKHKQVLCELEDGGYVLAHYRKGNSKFKEGFTSGFNNIHNIKWWAYLDD